MSGSARAVWIIAIVMLAGLVVAGCKSSSSTAFSCGSPSEDFPATPVTPTSDTLISPEDVLTTDPGVTKHAELQWAAMFELSGPPQVQGFGNPTNMGAQMAVDEINKADGFQVGDTIYTIDLLERDTQSNVAQTVAVTTELIKDKHVCVIFGPATLGETEATEFTQQARAIHLCPCQQREQNALSSVEKAHGDSRWAFQTLLPFSLLIEQAARNFKSEYPDLHTMALICQNSETGRDICERTKDAYEANGVEIVADIVYVPVGTNDYAPFLTGLRSADPDYLFNYDDPLNTVQIVKQALELDIGKLHLVTVPASLVRALVGRPLTVPVSAGAAPRQETQPQSQKAADYFTRLKEFNGGSLPLPAFPSLMTYDYVYMIAAAMQQAGTVDDTTQIAAALEQLHYNGVAEDNLFFNSRHLAVHGTEPCTVITGDDDKETITCTHNAPPPEAAE